MTGLILTQNLKNESFSSFIYPKGQRMKKNVKYIYIFILLQFLNCNTGNITHESAVNLNVILLTTKKNFFNWVKSSEYIPLLKFLLLLALDLPPTHLTFLNPVLVCEHHRWDSWDIPALDCTAYIWIDIIKEQISKTGLLIPQSTYFLLHAWWVQHLIGP